MAYAEKRDDELLDLILRIKGERTFTQLATDIGFSKQYVSNVCCGQKEPSEEFLQRLGIKRTVTVNYEVFPAAKRRSK